MEDEIIYRSLKEQATDAELKRIAAWRRTSPEAEQHYQELARMLNLMDAAQLDTAHPLADRTVPHAGSLMERVDQQEFDVPPPPRRVSWHSWPVQAVAAAALVLLGFSIARSRLADGATETAVAAEQYGTEFITGTGELATAHLEDGTVVRLAPRTRLVVTQWGLEREVTLSGRAFFAVAPLEGRVFRVRTDAGSAAVLGTRFELETSDDGLRLAVVEGRVSFTPGGGRAVEVSAGDLARVIDGQAAPVIRIGDMNDLLQWTGKFIAFQSTPLREAITDIERTYDVRVALMNQALADETITAWFVDRSLDEVLRIVSLALDANYSVEGRVVRIGR